MGFILFMIIVCLLFWLVEKLLNKWLGKDNRKISDTDGRMLDHRGKVSSFSRICEYQMGMHIYWLSFITLIFGFQSFMEWKFLKGSKEYLKILIFLGFALCPSGLLQVIRYSLF
jgi:hypothetical protein